MDEYIKNAPHISAAEEPLSMLKNTSEKGNTTNILANTDELVDFVGNKILFNQEDGKTNHETIHPQNPTELKIESDKISLKSISKDAPKIKNKIGKEQLIEQNKIPHLNIKIAFERDAPFSQDSAIHSEEDIPLFKIPNLCEQMADLYQLLEQKKSLVGTKTINNILQLGECLAKKADSNTTEILGKLIYLLTVLSDKDLQNASLKNEKLFQKWIQSKFKFNIESAMEKLLELKNQHLDTELQDANLAVRNHCSVVLSHIFFSATGKMNFGIIDTFIENFLPDKITPPQYRDHLIHTLLAFRDNPILRKKLADIEPQKSTKSPAALVIRSSLNMDPGQEITFLEVKKTIFAALTSHLRQGRDGSCFATPLAIVLLNTQIERCLDDLASLLKYNKLTRCVNHISRDFPFILKMSGSDLEKILPLNKQGNFINSKLKGKIYHAPGIVSACKILGITTPKEVMLEILHSHADEIKNGISLKSLLQKLVMEAKKLDENRNVGIGVLYQRACFAFEAQENNPLLQVWENAIAGMAEPDETGMVRSAVIDAIYKTIKEKLAVLMPSLPELRKTLRKSIYKTVLNRVHLQYDPVIHSTEKTVDKNSTGGAFVLYDKCSADNPENWVRIDNPKDFVRFIGSVLMNINDDFKIPPQALNAFKMSFDKLCKYVSTDHFLIACLNEYYHRNKDIPDPLRNYEQIKYAPWITKSGNNFSKVVQVYFEDFISSNSEMYVPKGPKDLLIKIIELGRKLIVTEEGQKQACTIIPIRIPKVHAFNLILTHPTMKQAWNHEINISDWVNTHVLLPGKQISEKLIEKHTYEKFLAAVKDQIIPEEMKKYIGKSQLNLSFKSMTIKELRAFALREMTTIFQNKTFSKTELCNQIDLILLDSLPLELKNEIKCNTLYFADTNWSDGLHDIHLCFLVNPGTGELEIFASYDDGGKLFPINPEKWINGKTWEFFTEVHLVK